MWCGPSVFLVLVQSTAVSVISVDEKCAVIVWFFSFFVFCTRIIFIVLLNHYYVIW